MALDDRDTGGLVRSQPRGRVRRGRRVQTLQSLAMRHGIFVLIRVALRRHGTSSAAHGLRTRRDGALPTVVETELAWEEHAVEQVSPVAFACLIWQN